MLRKLDEEKSYELHLKGKKYLELWRFLSLYAGAGYILFFIGIVLGSIDQLRTALIMSFAVLVTIIITFILRYIIRRPRPNYSINNYKPWMNNSSFPSAHASTVFSIAIVESFYFWQIGGLISLSLIAFCLLLAFAISVSRIMLGVHYLSDIFTGAILGSTISLIIIYLEFYL